VVMTPLAAKAIEQALARAGAASQPR